MKYCTNCGKQLSDSSKFCDRCGTPVESADNGFEREQEYKGTIYKCPNCGEVLDAFMSNCPSCGYEIRGAKASDSVQQLSRQLDNAKSESEMANIIRHFPIPNTKEDIWEFLILASSNIDGKLESEISSAWKAKLEQIMQKARLVFKDEELVKIEKQYQEIIKKLNKEKIIQSARKMGSALAELVPVLPQFIIIFGWLTSIFILLPMCRVGLDNVGTNASQLLLMLDFIAGAIFIPFTLRADSVLPKIVAIAGIILSIIVIILLCKENLDKVGTNRFQLILILEIICVVIIFVRMFRYNRKLTNRSATFNIASLMVAIVCVVIWLIVYEIGSLSIPKMEQVSNHSSPTISEDAYTDDLEGIYTYQIRNYVGKNVASVGKMSGDQLIDEYSSGEVRITLVTQDGMLVLQNDEKTKKGYTVVDQSVAAGSNIAVVHLRDSRGKPYSNLVDYQSVEEILLYIAPVGAEGFKPNITTI